MITRQTQYGFIQQVLIASICLIAVFTGGFLILDLGRDPYHNAPITTGAIEGDTGAQGIPIVAGMVTAPKFSLTPAKMLHQMQKDPKVDMPALVEYAVQSFDDTPKGLILQSYLIWAITANKSDAYIDSLLNSATAKGHFKTPEALLTLSGRLDTPSLLSAVQFALSRPNAVAGSEESRKHLLRLSDSLAGLSLAYYGDPQEHMRITKANKIPHLLAEASVGQVVKIPGR